MSDQSYYGKMITVRDHSMIRERLLETFCETYDTKTTQPQSACINYKPCDHKSLLYLSLQWILILFSPVSYFITLNKTYSSLLVL